MKKIFQTKINLPDVVGKGYGAFWRSKHRYRAIKGGRGSKKSKTTALWNIHHLMKYPEANLLVVRRHFRTLKDSCYSDLLWAIERLGVSHLWQKRLNPLELTYKPTGQKVLFRGLDDGLKITSISVPKGVLCWVWIEEAFELDDEAVFNKLDMSIRGEVPLGLWKQITLTFNPWSSKSWLKHRFFDVQSDFVFAATTNYMCNEWLDEEDLRLFKEMEKYDPRRYAIEGLGEWGTLGERFFDGWRESLHIVKPFKIPEGWVRFRCMDWGSAKPYAVYWCAVDYDGNIWVYRELYGYDGKPNVGTKETSKQVAEKIAYLEKDEKKLLHYGVLDNACWAKVDTGAPSVAESINKVMSANGCKLFNPSVKGREQMAEEMRLRLMGFMDKEGKQVPGIRFFSNCVHAIRTIPELVHDDRNPEKYDTDGEDHAADAIMYGLMSRPYAASRPKKPDLYSLDGWNERKEISPWGY